ncbi:TatD family hydrolase [Gordoniibacillus kamchatkensis]|uniref:TatD family hydrolase n=1 Tax=Gordoniibacillus kamchatkensis TaxID=1590651 RepID=UPI000AB310CC|nr:TatD family hydrolase [Paenibacillus sp. VKM B-2647]
MLEAIQAQPKWALVRQEDIEQVVRNSDKQRFKIEVGRIRARYGHSHDKVQYTPGEPPAILYHGTNKIALQSILKEGLSPMSRQYVHLSEGTHFATLAGSRRGELVILKVDTLGFYIGITGWICDERRGKHLKDLVRMIPLDRLMIETDAPFLTPRDVKEKPTDGRNEPGFLPHILQAVARCIGRPAEEVAKATTETAAEFFGI